MKKLIYIAALFISSGLITSCTKENGVKPNVTKISDAESVDFVSTEPIGNGDGGVDRPKKPHAN